MNLIRLSKQRASSAAACMLAAGLAISATAQTVLFDFGNDNTYRGLSAVNPDDNGNYWNSIGTGILLENLVDISNVATTIDFGFSTDVGTDSYNGPAGPTDESTLEVDVLFTDIDAEALGNLGGSFRAAFDYVTGPGNPGNELRFEIQGLNPASTYTLTFFGSHSFSDDAATVYSVYTDDTYTNVVDSGSLEVRDPVDFWLHNRDAVATISDLAPQADNILYVEVIGATGSLGYLNSMQLVATAAPILAGDYNNNGTVDAADYVIWRKNEGTTNTLPNDPHGDEIDIDQYNTWRANFGMTSGGSGGIGGSTAIPEPASLALALVAAIGLFSLGRRC